MRERESRPMRCAIYTRKSTEEGLEQEFNSLDAQREACAAYILSQRHEGWTAVPDIYDDGGYTGGNMERPGLRALLAEVAAGRVDIIVVYKVDRLTRSLADFAKIVEVLDTRGASFVSVTQSFNTTTSMGRLTLNVLLSFAQFEREVTGERIRDKIAASKAKGMWMGGPIPLGYDLGERKLIINPVEAETIRHIFSRYLKLRSGRMLVAELDDTGIRSKARVDRHGRPYGAQSISRGALYAMLQNRLYVGEVVHNGNVYPGQHAAIIGRAQFEDVQRQLELRRVERRTRSNAKHPSMFAGLLIDGVGRRMSPSHAIKSARRYRYYVSQNDGAAAASEPCWRVSAADIEGRVTSTIIDLMEVQRDRAIANDQLSPDTIGRLSDGVRDATTTLRSATDSRAVVLLASILKRIELSHSKVTITAAFGSIDPALDSGEPILISVPLSWVRTAKQVKLVIPPASSNDALRDPGLVKLVAQALTLRERLMSHAASTFDGLASALGYSREYAADLLRVSYLAPDIISAILDGRQPKGLTRTKLIKMPRLPLDWQGQRLALGFA
jgi:site-specific DNA recombinase